MNTSKEVSGKLNPEDYTIDDIINLARSPEVAEGALRDLLTSTAKFVNGKPFEPGDFQELYGIVSGVITAFKQGASREHIIMALEEGWKKGTTS